MPVYWPDIWLTELAACDLLQYINVLLALLRGRRSGCSGHVLQCKVSVCNRELVKKFLHTSVPYACDACRKSISNAIDDQDSSNWVAPEIDHEQEEQKRLDR